jgi:hypothetical protein
MLSVLIASSARYGAFNTFTFLPTELLPLQGKMIFPQTEQYKKTKTVHLEPSERQVVTISLFDIVVAFRLSGSFTVVY